MSSLPKPMLRGHIKRRGLRGLVGAFVFAAVNGSLIHFLVNAPKKRGYDEFFKTYDAQAHFKELEKWGYISFDNFVAELKSE